VVGDYTKSQRFIFQLNSAIFSQEICKKPAVPHFVPHGLTIYFFSLLFTNIFSKFQLCRIAIFKHYNPDFFHNDTTFHAPSIEFGAERKHIFI
jgi:hypothetical protein